MQRGSLFLLAGLVALSAAAQERAQKCPSVDSEIKRDRLFLLAKQPDGLHKAALANCGSIGTYTAALDHVAVSLEDLVAKSSTILVGTPTEENTLLVDDGRYVVTEYAIRVAQVLKGAPADPGRTAVVMVGGTYKFQDGTQAAEICYCRKPLIGHNYIIFSNPLRSSSKKLVPSFEDQGIVELAGDGVRIMPYSTQFFDFFNRYPGRFSEQTQTQFLGDVQTLIANHAANKSQ
jgi:hypothetical protein